MIFLHNSKKSSNFAVDMKQKLLILLVALWACALPTFSAENGRSLTNTLDELHTELKSTYVQRTESKKFFQSDYERQHKQMIHVITQTNKLSILLYTQEQRRTFDMAYALKKVTSGYKDFNQGRRPYDQIYTGLTFEIDRYARLIEALRRLPPELDNIEVEIIPDSLLYHNDSLDMHLSNTPSTLEKEIIHYAVKDQVSSPFVLDESGEKYRDSCILYASELLRMYADRRDSVVIDSTHYLEAYLRTKEAYDYAEERYSELDKYVYVDGQIPYPDIIVGFSRYWNKMKRDLANQYDFDALDKIAEDDEDFFNHISGRAEKAFLVVACFAQLITLFLSWLVLFGILWLLCRFTRLKNYISKKTLPLFSVLVGTILYFLMFGYFWEGSDYLRSGVMNINRFLWLLMVIFGSLLVRVKPEKLRFGVMLYIPTILLALIIIVCRNTFVPDILMDVVFTPVLMVAVLGQLYVCVRSQGRATKTDSILGWVSLGIYLVTLGVSFFGYVFAALIYLVWWYFMLTALLAVLCLSDLLDRYKERKLDPRVAAKLKRKDITAYDKESLQFSVTWFYDLVKQVVIPTLLLLALPWSVKLALDMFDFTDLFTRYFYEPFFQLTDEATGASSLCISAMSIVHLAILFFVLRYLNRCIHVLWRHIRYTAFMRKNKRTTVRTNEINLSLGNSIISVVIWAIYAMVVIIEWNIPTGSLGLIAGGLSAGIGIALKDIINNFIYGIQLMGGRLRVGDWIECEGVRGSVTAINYQCVQMETIDGTEMSFLNSSLFGKNFINLTRNNSYERTKIIVGVSYGTDIEKVREVLVAAMEKMRTKDRYGREIIDPQKGISVIVDKMSDSSVDVAVKQYVLVAERIEFMDRAKEVVYDALKEAGITIPFPQRDVHIIQD